MTSITLYTYFRSSCSARLRIALALKNLPYAAIPINLLKDEQHSAQNTINPSATVPTLIISSSSPNSTTNNTEVTITQSLAALEYLEEAFPATPSLLPPVTDPSTRALVRTLSHIIACDVQPVTNLRILKRVAPFGVDRAAWSKELIEDGFRAYEALAVGAAGKFSVGDAITMADVCLIPAVWGAQRVGVDLGMYPTIERVARNLEEVEAVKVGHWRTQEDTPEEFRV
ncbi:maleylacetoacetate isomerase [Aspergillus steynii IBT 23096]|uniref:Maleylacetoacetate isomerase n=1 Tax=Aspergillus steynii IBT 23096 TaxID=1392250 RepID=A0A2I2GRR7_9EURO|nr:maleylacetoacetate isomerase [Aspergillus steynii IBT 23096]PLB55565.1 maleylacetoacetate isomerase [Aspergillus steynii IBT 23096]